jgi:CRISPR-associated protein Cmr3
MLATQRGWHPEPSSSLPPELGDSENLGQLQLRGPFVGINGTLLYPMPLILFGHRSEEEKIESIQRLVPGPPVESDLGKAVRFLQVRRREKGNVLECWGTEKALSQVLQGKVPDVNELKWAEDLWRLEQKFGIQRDFKKQIVKDGYLYTSQHIRVRHGVTVEVEVSGVTYTADQYPVKLTVPLGGEGRFAGVEIEPSEMPLPPKLNMLNQRKDGKCLYTLSLLTPGLWTEEQLAEVIRKGPHEAPGTCISASIPKCWRIGGWDLERKKRRPILPLLPPGCTWFYEADASQMEAILALHNRAVGEKREYGLGHLVVGTWEEQEAGE